MVCMEFVLSKSMFIIIYSNLMYRTQKYKFFAIKLGLALREWLLLSLVVTLIIGTPIYKLRGHGLHDLF